MTGADEELRRELLARRDEDQLIRALVSRPAGKNTTKLPDEAAAQWRRIDEDNTRWLAGVVSARGWPGRTLAGEDGAAAAWLLAQARGPRSCPAAGIPGCTARRGRSGEASRSHLAYLEDRVRVNAGQPQLYGTQFTETNGELRPRPIGDPHRLDERRAEAGLEPFADYEARMRTLP